MFKYLIAKQGYLVQIPGSPSTFQVACGYWATTKSYTVEDSFVTLGCHWLPNCTSNMADRLQMNIQNCQVKLIFFVFEAKTMTFTWKEILQML